jgi:hypothetical protein
VSIAFVSGSAGGTSASASLSVTAPSGIVTGNLLIALVGDHSTTATSPAGWTTVTAPSGGVEVAIFYKYATASEPSSYTFTGARYMAAAILQYSGAAAASPVDVYAAAPALLASPVSFPAITTTAAGDLILAVLYDYNGDVDWTTPTGLTKRASFAASYNEYIGTFDETQSTAGAVGPFTSTTAGSPNAATVTLAIKAAATVSPNQGTASGGANWTGSASGSVTHKGTGSALTTTHGSAAGTAAHAGTATGHTAIAGTATGSASHGGTATGATSNTGTATGTTTHQGAASGSTASTGSAAGTRPSSGTATGHTAWTGTASGTAPTVAPHTGQATSFTSWTAAASGSAPAVGAHTGHATGATTWSGTATGTTTRRGTATGTTLWTATGSGSAPTLGGHAGTGAGATTWTGVATGKISHAGQVAALTHWTGTASGTIQTAGVAVGGYLYVGTTAGLTPPMGRDITIATGPISSRTLTGNPTTRSLLAGMPASRTLTGVVTT